MAEIRYASTIWAMTRRNGDYSGFGAIHHIGAGNARDALLRSASWFERLQGLLETLKQDSGLLLAEKTIQQVEESVWVWKRSFAEIARAAAIEVYKQPLESDHQLWNDCATQWGKGPGFKGRVLTRVRNWFEKHTDLNDEIERLMTVVWEKNVIGQLARLANESAAPIDKPRGGGRVVVFRRKA
jgi:hypothetical protein